MRATELRSAIQGQQMQKADEKEGLRKVTIAKEIHGKGREGRETHLGVTDS